MKRLAVLLLLVGCERTPPPTSVNDAARFAALALDAGVRGLVITPDPSAGTYAFSFSGRFAEVSALVAQRGRDPGGCSSRWLMVTNLTDPQVVLVDVFGAGAFKSAPGCLSWSRLARALDGVTAGITRDCWTTRIEQRGETIRLQGQCAGNPIPMSTAFRENAAFHNVEGLYSDGPRDRQLFTLTMEISP